MLTLEVPLRAALPFLALESKRRALLCLGESEIWWSLIKAAVGDKVGQQLLRVTQRV